MEGDCLDKMGDIPDKSIDMILCDLPYGTTTCKWDIIIPFDKLWQHYRRVIKDKGSICLFGSQPFSSLLIASNLKQFKYELIWNKNKCGSPGLAKYRPMKTHENILIFLKKVEGLTTLKWRKENLTLEHPRTQRGTKVLETLTDMALSLLSPSQMMVLDILSQS